MKLHLPSVLVALAIAALVVITSSQSAVRPTLAFPVGAQVEYRPHPRDMVQIKEGTTYTVPAGKLFVLTGLGSRNLIGGTFTQITLMVNGAHEVSSFGPYYGNGSANLEGGSSVVATPPGFTAPAGALIEVIGDVVSPDDSRAWGYLANE